MWANRVWLIHWLVDGWLVSPKPLVTQSTFKPFLYPQLSGSVIVLAWCFLPWFLDRFKWFWAAILFHKLGLFFEFQIFTQCRLYLTRETDTKIGRAKSWEFVNTVSPHIRPAVTIISCSLQMRVLLENTTFLLHKVIRIAGIFRVAGIIWGRVLYSEIRYSEISL